MLVLNPTEKLALYVASHSLDFILRRTLLPYYCICKAERWVSWALIHRERTTARIGRMSYAIAMEEISRGCLLCQCRERAQFTLHLSHSNLRHGSAKGRVSCAVRRVSIRTVGNSRLGVSDLVNRERQRRGSGRRRPFGRGRMDCEWHQRH
jgi:hypothetical protein